MVFLEHQLPAFRQQYDDDKVGMRHVWEHADAGMMRRTRPHGDARPCMLTMSQHYGLGSGGVLGDAAAFALRRASLVQAWAQREGVEGGS
eukprot:365661-Chlamydomonas_euryale.AAC.87